MSTSVSFLIITFNRLITFPQNFLLILDLSRSNKYAAIPQSPAWGAVAPSTHGPSVSAIPCARTTKAAAWTFTPSAPKRVSPEAR